ncbi:MAG: 4-hydroxy-tetrahydrodipicolinate synthase [Phycisphaeraceae bacterium]|nr:4-hydroxy-tetrahydrodipicolinate synthase [Phycisphaeraceae bacterium]
MPSLNDPRFTGAFTAIVTPFTQNGEAIDYDRLAAQIEFQAKGERGTGGVKGIVVCGTTGESPTLTEREYQELVKRAVELGHKHKLLVIAGTGSNATAHALHNQTVARDAGADGTLSVNPYYNKPTQEGLYRHFAAIAEAAEKGGPILPIILYNIPGRTGVALTTATVERLAKFRSIVAVKEATGSLDSGSEIAMKCPNLALLSGDDSLTLPFASVGGVGVVSVVSNILPGRVAALCAAFNGGNWDNALRIHRELYDFCRAMFLETNPIPVKGAMRLLGRDSGVLRLPMCDASAATMAAVRQALTAQGLL